MRIRFTPTALSQLNHAIDYIFERDMRAAIKVLNRIEEATQNLLVFPEMGHAISDFPQAPFRELNVDSYRVFYKTEGEWIVIVSIWHSRQIPELP